MKNLIQRLRNLERRAGITNLRILLIYDYSLPGEDPEFCRIDTAGGATVFRQPGEEEDAFFTRAETELRGDDAEKPGAYILYAYPKENPKEPKTDFRDATFMEMEREK